MSVVPVVSIAMPVFNAESTLDLAIRSVLAQTFEDWELIVVDDGSSDGSLEIASSFSDERIVVIGGGGNLGISARLNQAIDLARGDFFARMDGDDVCFPQRLEKQIAFLLDNPSVDLLASSTLIFQGHGEVRGVLRTPQSHEEICARPWAGFLLPHPTWMGRIQWFRSYRYDSRSDGVEDQHLLYRSFSDSQFASLDAPLVGYRFHERSLGQMWSKRWLFATRCGGSAWQNGFLWTASLIVLIQGLKTVADLFRALLGHREIFHRSLSGSGSNESGNWSRVIKQLTNES